MGSLTTCVRSLPRQHIHTCFEISGVRNTIHYLLLKLLVAVGVVHCSARLLHHLLKRSRQRQGLFDERLLRILIRSAALDKLGHIK